MFLEELFMGALYCKRRSSVHSGVCGCGGLIDDVTKVEKSCVAKAKKGKK